MKIDRIEPATHVEQSTHEGEGDPKVAQSLTDARRIITDALGSETIRALHRQDRKLDALAVISVFALVLGCGGALSRLPFGALWTLLLVAQGFFLQLLLLVFHDVFLHRRVGSPRLRSIVACCLTLPFLISPTAYEVFHVDHHARLNTDDDTEAYKQSVDTWWKRIVFSTLPGFLWFKHWPVRDLPDKRARIQIERRLMIVVAAVLAGLAFLYPRALGFGFVLPVVTTLPFVSVLRIILEHAEADETNPFFAGTYYRTGFFTRVLFLWDCGDCHVVHHLFAAIPFYRMGRAVELMRPIFLAHGVNERRSLLSLLHGYYIEAQPHRSRWST